MTTNCRATLSLSEHGTRLQRGSAPSSCRTPVANNKFSCNSSYSNNKQRAGAVVAQGSPVGYSTGRHAAPAAAAAAVLRNNDTAASSSNLEDSYDFEEAAAAPMHALPGSRIQPEKSFDESEQPLYGGTFDGTHYDSQNWEEMTSLLSFDGEEHRHVIRHMPGAGMRVEDMFASFDGDDFEAVMTAAVRSSEPPGTAAVVAQPAPIRSSTTNSSLDSGDEPEDLYLAVGRHRAAAMAAEAANKQSPKPKRRKAPLGSRASDAWMFQLPVNTPAAAQMQSLSLEQQYEAAQRALLPPLEVEAAAEAKAAGAVARQRPVGVGAAGAVVAAAGVAPAQQTAKQQQAQQQEVVVVVLQRPDAGDRPVTPAPHAAHAQPAGEPHQLLLTKLNSSSSRVRLLSEAAALGRARPAASASEGMLGNAGVGAATVATQQRQPGEARNFSSRVLSAAPVLLAPLVAATAEMAGAASAGGLNAWGAAAEEAEAQARLPALSSSDDEEYEHEMVNARVLGGSSSSKTGDSCRAASAGEAGLAAGVVYDDGVRNGGFGYVKVRQPVGRAALRRALSKLKCSMVLADRPAGSSSSSSY